MTTRKFHALITRRIEIDLDTPIMQWVASFLFFDAIVWSLAFVGLVVSGGAAAEGVLLMFPLFYSPFWLFVPDMGEVGGLAINNLAMPIVGAVFHASLGVAAGTLFKDRDIDTVTSKAIAFSVILALIIGSYLVLDARGYFI